MLGSNRANVTGHECLGEINKRNYSQVQHWKSLGENSRKNCLIYYYYSLKIMLI